MDRKEKAKSKSQKYTSGEKSEKRPKQRNTENRPTDDGQSSKPVQDATSSDDGKKKRKKKKLVKLDQSSDPVQDASSPNEGSEKRKKKKLEVVKQQPETEFREQPERPSGIRGTGGALKSETRRAKDAEKPVEDQPFLAVHATSKGQTKPVDADLPSPSPYSPATLTGFRELPRRKIFLIALLWLPRLFIPWITEWHEFNVYVLSNPWDWGKRESELHQQLIFVFVGKSIIAILCSAAVNLIGRRWKLEFYIYLCLLVLFTMSPGIGAWVDELLRAGIQDGEEYKEWWFTSVVLMQWAISTGFMMFPVQLACIYTQHNKMSRNAHYGWSSFFVLFEFISEFFAFMSIPPPCPTDEWTQIVVWIGLLLCLLTITVLTVIFFFAIPAIKELLLLCFNRKGLILSLKPDPEAFLTAPSKLKIRKLIWFSLIVGPIIWSSFCGTVIGRFVATEYEEKHEVTSAIGIFQFCKVLGVVLMASVMLVGRKDCARMKPFGLLKVEVIFLGLPHCLYILALVTLVGRLSTLSHLKEGDVISGPIPDKDKTVLVFVNRLVRNRTVCISSEYFPAIRIRPSHLVTREIYDVGVGNLGVNVELDPRDQAAKNLPLRVEKIKKGEWKIYGIHNPPLINRHLDVWDFYRSFIYLEIVGVGNPGPKVGDPELLILEYFKDRYGCNYYQFNHSSIGTKRVPFKNFVISGWKSKRKKNLQTLPATGRWIVRVWNKYYERSYDSYQYQVNRTWNQVPLAFDVERNNFYLMSTTYYQPIVWSPPHRICFEFYNRWDPPIRYYGTPISFEVFKLGEVAGPNNNRLPDREELQKDGPIKISVALAGMATGGIFLGFVYLFWVDPPMPRYRIISLAVCWVLMGVASEVPRISQIEVSIILATSLLILQIFMTGLHFVGAHYMYAPALNFRLRPD